ncbi:hypothetical protein H257_07777 [Aphanomyces astaci]|uniref:Uncharacterized protein n=1 Tax=Aphanomyces astaci TaxID=112090 RepID=W4GIY7_APHAT|nr:hypothetical protein H257_07777 [Aphanomyces astaci]ETV78989.1 hypothetical protein H257_07777 [Aphanomyces astaci]|eukprot:XP_009831708.1 hypothetical protein H257_07777 [Aphanomyces astaci]
MNIASNNILRGRQLAELYFTRNAAGSTDWTCRCGARRGSFTVRSERASCQKPNFESVIVKILRGTETTITAEECASVIKLRNEEIIESSTAGMALPVMYLAEQYLPS